MANNTLTINLPDKIDPCLLNVKGRYSKFDHYVIFTLICSFLLLCIFLACYVIYSTINDIKSSELLVFANGLMVLLAIFCSFFFVKIVARWNKMNYMEITDKGIFYSEDNIFGGQQKNDVYWQNLFSNQQVNIIYRGGTSARSIAIPYVEFFPLSIPAACFTRSLNAKELISAFILNLANTHKKVTCSEQVFYFFNIDEETIFNPPKMLINTEQASAKQQTVQGSVINTSNDIQQQFVTSNEQPVAKHTKRRRVERLMVWLSVVLIVISCQVVLSLHLNPLASTFLVILLSMGSVVMVLVVAIKKINKVSPKHQRVAYHIKEQQQASDKTNLKDD